VRAVDAELLLHTDAGVVARVRTSGRARAIVVSAVLVGAVGLAVIVAVAVGDFPVPLGDVLPGMIGAASDDVTFVVQTLRLPRVLTGVLVGAAFALSGTVFQSLARNPLASPDIIGVTAGASAGAVLVIVAGGSATAPAWGAAIVGASVTAIAIYALAYRRGLSAYRLVLVGIGLGAVLAAFTAFLLTRAEIMEAQRAVVWLTGSLNGRGWNEALPVALVMAVLVPLTLVLVRPLRTLQLGDDLARGLGVRIEVARGALVAAAVVAAAVATAAAGPIAFVAFVAPPIARRLVRAPLTVVPAVLAGSFLVVVSDTIARMAFSPTELPVGVVTGIVGGPYLIWLIARANRIGAGG
jgi:iron complex transport system permease protein